MLLDWCFWEFWGKLSYIIWIVAVEFLISVDKFLSIYSFKFQFLHFSSIVLDINLKFFSGYSWWELAAGWSIFLSLDDWVFHRLKYLSWNQWNQMGDMKSNTSLFGHWILLKAINLLLQYSLWFIYTTSNIRLLFHISLNSRIILDYFCFSTFYGDSLGCGRNLMYDVLANIYSLPSGYLILSQSIFVSLRL